MSKASQRKEADRRKRLEKKHGKQGAKLMARIEKYGPEVLESPYEVLAAMAEMGPVVKATPARKRLESLADAFRPVVRTLWQQLTGWDGTESAGFALEMPSFIAVWNKLDELVGMVPARRVVHEWNEEAPTDGTVEWLFRSVEADGIAEGDVVAWVVGASTSEDYATFCLWANRDASATAAHVLVDGRWIVARVPEKIWGAGLVVAESAADEFWADPGVDRLVASEPEHQDHQQTAQNKREWLADLIAREQWLHLESWWRLLQSYQAAEEEANFAWSAAEEGHAQGRSKLVELEKGLLVHKDSVATVRQLQGDLIAARQEASRLRGEIQLTKAPGSSLASKAAEPELSAHEHANAVIKRVAAFF
jgi:hypothetical protein